MIYPRGAQRLDMETPWAGRDHPGNPLVGPGLRWVVADPAVATAAESPDGRWHMLTCSGLRISHFVSPDGLRWKRRRDHWWFGFNPMLLKDGGEFYLYYRKHGKPPTSTIVARRSKDLARWSEPQEVLAPKLPWESRTVKNPAVVKWKRRYLLYYGADRVWLPDVRVYEPKVLGLAEGPGPLGPFERRPEPILVPKEEDPWRNMGAGGLKAYRGADGGLLGFQNTIYRDREGKTRSVIWVLRSGDGVQWEPLFPKPLLEPDPAKKWKRGLVYQLDAKRVGDDLWLYYNSRSGWFAGREAIGLTVFPGAGVHLEKGGD